MKKIIILITVLLFPAGAYASGAGTTAANFLKVSMSPRAMALAGAFSALADDSGAVFSNPAGLASFKEKEMGFDFVNYIQDSKMGNFSFAGNIGERRFGLGVNMLSITGIERRTATDNAQFVSKTGDFGSTDMALSLVFAKEKGMENILENVDTGMALKFIRSSIDDSSAFAIALDAGLIYHASAKINVAMALQNLGTKMKYEDVADPLPLDLKFGLLYKASERLNLLSEINEYFNDEKFYAAFAAEYWMRDALALRGGYKFGYDTSNLGSEVGLSLGFGLKVSGLGIDYAYLPFGELGNIHKFGFWMQF